MTRRYVFACTEVDHDIQIDTITVDVVVGPSPVGRPQVVEPANRLHLRRPLITHPYRLYPVADQIADKVCATMDSNYPGGKRSSRVRDLVDLVVLAQTQSLDLAELRQAIEAKRLISNIEPFERFGVPAAWARTFASTEKDVPLAMRFTASTAAGMVGSFVDPALQTDSSPATWDPRELVWNARRRSPEPPATPPDHAPTR